MTDPDPKQVLREARDLAASGAHAEALEKYVWFYENANAINPALCGVRNSFALGYWVKLGEDYPPARSALETIRDAKLDALRKGLSNPELFSDVSAINEVLGQLELTGSLFAGIASKDREFAQKCFPSARVALVRLGEYALARTFIKSPRSTLEMLADLLNRSLEANPSPPTARSLMLQNADVENYIEDVQHLLEILAGVGANDEAHHLRLLAIESVNRTEIRDQIKEKLSDL